MSLSSLDQTSKRVLMFGGKGGVGKTTTSASTALHFARSGRRTLILSSDLTPSLSDIFETQVGATETPVPGEPKLWALEINPDEVMRRWKIKFGPEIYQAASALVDMPYDDVVDYVAMAPGIQEEFLLDFILEHVRADRYDLVVWDTAPAGDTLRLLELPHKFLAHLRVAPKMYLGLRDRLGLNRVPFIDLIESWKELSEEITAFFRDPEQTEFVLVTIPEALGAFQAQRVVGDLAQFGLDVGYLVINHVAQPSDGRFMQQRRQMQQPYLDLLIGEYGQRMSITQVPLLPHEVKGLARLDEMATLLFSAS
jgi:arsenite-transporting ATPase